MTRMEPAAYIRLALRVLLYVLGLFCLAVGVALSINSELGVSPVNSLPYILSQISGAAMSTCVITLFSFYILLQWLILRRAFKPVSFFQLLFSIIFGYFVDLAKFVVGGFTIPTYFGRLLLLAISIFFVGLGIIFYIETDLVPLSSEGLTLALVKKLKRFSFPMMKTIMDCIMVAAAVLISLLFFGRVVGVREGTIITALLVGKVVALLKKPLSPLIRRICFDGEAQVDRN